MSHCVFCDILAGGRPASVVFRDDSCWAFMDVQPINPGHVLVIPTYHAPSLAELDHESGAHMFRVAQQVASALRDGALRCEGVSLLLADGSAAGQVVPHVHIHVVPRYLGDGFGLEFGPGYGVRPSRAELDAAADRIRQSL